MSIIQIADNDYKGVSINNDDTENIKRFANKKIKYLKENNLFILSKNSFKDDIENLTIIELDEVNNKIYSNNIMGFIGYNDTQIKLLQDSLRRMKIIFFITCFKKFFIQIYLIGNTRQKEIIHLIF